MTAIQDLIHKDLDLSQISYMKNESSLTSIYFPNILTRISSNYKICSYFSYPLLIKNY